MNNELMFSSKNSMWDTPQDLIDDLATVFIWDLDVCASRPNVCETYIDETQNGRGIGKWLARALAEAQRVTTVMLVPARTDTGWNQHNYVPYATQVVYIL